MKRLWILCLTFLPLFAANILQDAIDKAKPGSLLELPAGVYKGNIVINKPLIIDGKNQKAIIDGDGNGTVVSINSSYVTLKNLTIRNSGAQHEKLDSGVSLKKVRHVKILHCKIVDILFGLDLQEAHQCTLSYNYISSKPLSLGMRGDGIRIWYSNDNVIDHNHIYKSRDFVVWYSNGNIIKNNLGEYCRYSLHFMYTGKNIVKDNVYKHNSVGIFFMYSQDTIATGNVVENSLGTTGLGIGLKDASNFTIKNNTLIYCARGLYIDRSPFQPDTFNYIEGNKLLYNSEAVRFHSLSLANIFKNNVIKGNIDNIINDSYNTKVEENVWEGNYWDNYQGFDKNHDGVGDTPHVEKYYADRMWMLNPSVKFFYGSPIITIINFLAKLAPLSEPVVLAVDKNPKTKIGDKF